MENPLITIGLTCYNQEKYIREALEGCFAQTYSPLEIIVSDNNSTDGSVSIIGDMINEYKRKDGRHAIIFNKNEANLGYVGNLLKIFTLMHGELLVEASGDDISFPDRVEVIANEWVKTNKLANLVAHGGRRIDTQGNALDIIRPSDDTRKTGLLLAHEIPSDWFVGAFHAYSPRILSEFANPEPNLTGVDNLFGFRALMLGPILFLDDILIKYRIDSGVSTGVLSWRQSRLSQSKRLMLQLYQALDDLDKAIWVDKMEADVISP